MTDRGRDRGKTHLQRTVGRPPQSDRGRVCELIQALRPRLWQQSDTDDRDHPLQQVCCTVPSSGLSHPRRPAPANRACEPGRGPLPRSAWGALICIPRQRSKRCRPGIEKNPLKRRLISCPSDLKNHSFHLVTRCTSHGDHASLAARLGTIIKE